MSNHSEGNTIQKVCVCVGGGVERAAHPLQENVLHECAFGYLREHVRAAACTGLCVRVSYLLVVR